MTAENEDEAYDLIASFCRRKGWQTWPTPIRQYKFDSKRKWRLDFAWPDRMVAIELHGGVWTQGRHTRGGGFEKDREKMNAAVLAGWKVGEFSYKQLNQGHIWTWLEKAMENSCPN